MYSPPLDLEAQNPLLTSRYSLVELVITKELVMTKEAVVTKGALLVVSYQVTIAFVTALSVVGGNT